MLPFEIQELLKSNSVRIVIDNAKSHGSRIKRRRFEKPKSPRRMSAPLVVHTTDSRTAKKKASRWDSSTSSPAPSAAPSTPKKTPCCILRDLAPELKLSSASLSPSSQTTLCCSSLCNVSKPVRRTSGDQSTLSFSLPFNECCTNSTSELLGRVLDDVHLFDDDDDDGDDDVDTLASVLSAPARLVTGLTSAVSSSLC
jgi:hypothetical protein